ISLYNVSNVNTADKRKRYPGMITLFKLQVKKRAEVNLTCKSNKLIPDNCNTPPQHTGNPSY
ncbi:hypothetical protein BgiMline_031017, partial [Biomphalaria glabrata]